MRRADKSWWWSVTTIVGSQWSSIFYGFNIIHSALKYKSSFKQKWPFVLAFTGTWQQWPRRALHPSATALHVHVYVHVRILIGIELHRVINFSCLKPIYTWDVCTKVCIILINALFAYVVFLKQILLNVFGVKEKYNIATL